MYYNEHSILFLDGQWIKAETAQISPYSQTLHYGNGVFEGIRAYLTTSGVRIYKAEEHFERLLYSARKMHIPLTYTLEEMTELAYLLLEKNELEDAYIRPLVFTSPNMSLTPPDKAHLFMCAWKWGKLLGDKTVDVMTSSFCRPHPKSCFVAAKVVGHYTNSILATTEAKAKNFDEALLLDVAGYVAEGPGANFFYEKDDVLYTPPTGNILPGITRSTVLQICKRIGVRVEEKRFRIEDVHHADGAFFVGTAAEVTGIASLDRIPFRKKWENTLGHSLQMLYKAEVLNEVVTNSYL
jgi:branched-chain amino acid aminotransferase